MGSPVTLFEVTKKLDRVRIASQLQPRYQLSFGAPVALTRTYCDTFDWRLHAAGTTFTVELDFERAALVDLDGEEVCGARVTEPPRFATDLPRGRLRDRVADLAKIRALLAIATVEVKRSEIALRNRDQKIVARLIVERARLITAGRTKRLPTLARIAPVKGYRRPAERLRRVVEALPGVRPATAGGFDLALRALGQEPGVRRRDIQPALEPHTRADVATRSVLLSYLDIIDENEPGVRDDIDTEFLHDFRVALRRTRTLLSRVRGVFPEAATSGFAADFKWLGEVTTPTRDLDVYLLEFDRYRKSIPAEMRPDLEPLREFLFHRRMRSQREMVLVLDSDRYRSLVAGWRRFLTSPAPAVVAPAAERPVVEVAGAEILRSYRKVRRAGRAITRDSPATALHELRKDCKKLRYLIEAYQSVFPAAAVKKMSSLLKELQDNLGTINDLDVQSVALGGFATAMLDEGASPATLLAMGVLIGHLEERSRDVRALFADCFARFARTKSNRFVKRAFGEATLLEETGP